MSSTSAALGANSAFATPAAATTDVLAVAASETQTNGQASFARIMSDATAGGATDTPSSNTARVTGDKSENDGKRKDNKAQVQQVVAQIAAAIVAPQAPLPAVVASAGGPPAGGATPGIAPVCAETVQTRSLAAGDVLGPMIIPGDKAAGNDAGKLTNTKLPAGQPLPDGPKPITMPATESGKETQSSVTNGQLSVTEPSAPPNANSAPVESAAQPTLAADAGTAIAKQVGRMKMQEKTENNSEVAEKNLPPASFVAQAAATGDSAKPRTTPANLPQREGRGSTTTEASAPILAGLVQGKTQAASNNTDADAVRSPQADKVFTEISERVMSFKRMGADSAEVNLRPDSSTEITLSLSLRNGQVEMTARLERGNLSALNPHWTGLQQSLSQQGVRVGQLTSSQSAMNDQLSSGTSQQGSGENTSRSFERGPESLDDLSLAGSTTEPLKGRPQKPAAAAGRGWEMWA